TDTINSVKVKIHQREGIPPESQRLIYGQKIILQKPYFMVITHLINLL
ncbi:MAG: hypothetical protein EOP34_10810, partial [Rickettsiales bacterium]